MTEQNQLANKPVERKWAAAAVRIFCSNAEGANAADLYQRLMETESDADEDLRAVFDEFEIEPWQVFDGKPLADVVANILDAAEMMQRVADEG